MKKRSFEYTVHDFKCRACGKIQGYILNPNMERGNRLKEIILNDKVCHTEYPYEIRWCEYCKADTMQDWVRIRRGTR